VDQISQLFFSLFSSVAHIRIQGPLHLSDYSEPIPDIMLLRPSPDRYRSRHPIAEDVLLLVEVSDTSLPYDRRKLRLYASHGVVEVWIVDINHEVILVHRLPSGDSYQVIGTRRRGDQIAVAAFPKIEFAVEEILG
jgi:Uma2 family endonuclease